MFEVCSVSLNGGYHVIFYLKTLHMYLHVFPYYAEKIAIKKAWKKDPWNISFNFIYQAFVANISIKINQ